MNGDAQIRHALVVGGTGMLRGVCLQLAREGWLVSVIARDRLRLRELAHEFVGRISPLPLDYTDSHMLGAVLSARMASLGPISLIIAWIHDTVPDAARIIAERVSAVGSPVRFFHVLGSSAVDPTCLHPEMPEWAKSLPSMRYHRIILGFVIEDCRSRWLTNEEICDGVLRAVAAESSSSTIGVVTPWSSRP